MTKKGKIIKRILFGVEIVVLLLFIGILYIYGQISTRMDVLEESTEEPAAHSTGEYNESEVVTNDTAPVMTGYTTYALFGIDHRSKNATLNTQNSDTMIIASVNNDTKEIKLVSLYRDTLLNIGNDTYAKANAAYAYGGAQQAVSMLNTMLDLDISDYATVDFNGLVEAVDALGGLDIPLSYAEMVHLNNYCVEVSEETGKSYEPLELPETEPEDLEAVVGTYHLNGVQVTSYCRIRYTGSLDMGRTVRQRQVLQMLLQKVKDAGLTGAFSLMDSVFPEVTTSLTKEEILSMIPTMIGYGMAETTGFPFNFKFATVNVRGSVIVADSLESNVKQLHEYLYGADDSYTPSQNILDASAKIIEIVGGADTLADTAPTTDSTTEDDNTDFFWQDDGNGGNAWDNGDGSYTDPNSENTSDSTYTELTTADSTSTEPATSAATSDSTYTEPATSAATSDSTYTEPATSAATSDSTYTEPATSAATSASTYTEPTTSGYTDSGSGSGEVTDDDIIYVDPGDTSMDDTIIYE